MHGGGHGFESRRLHFEKFTFCRKNVKRAKGPKLVAPAACSGGLGPHRLVHAHFPLDLPQRIRVGLRVGQEPVPGALPLQRLKRSKQVCQGP